MARRRSLAFMFSCPDKGWRTVRPDQVDLGMTIAEHMHMGGLVIVCENDDAQPMRAVDRNHEWY